MHLFDPLQKWIRHKRAYDIKNSHLNWLILRQEKEWNSRQKARTEPHRIATSNTIRNSENMSETPMRSVALHSHCTHDPVTARTAYQTNEKRENCSPLAQLYPLHVICNVYAWWWTVDASYSSDISLCCTVIIPFQSENKNGLSFWGFVMVSCWGRFIMYIYGYQCVCARPTRFCMKRMIECTRWVQVRERERRARCVWTNK